MTGITPDVKDWTWTLRERCPECGMQAGSLPRDEIADTIRLATAPWALLLTRPGVARRPDPHTWSPLEYGCHVRDVCELFAGRTQLMLEQDNPQFANWDQDATAVESDYAAADPDEVAVQIEHAGQRYAAIYDSLGADQWERPGRRSNGSLFTVTTLGQYGVHDLVHHLRDVGLSPTVGD